MTDTGGATDESSISGIPMTSRDHQAAMGTPNQASLCTFTRRISLRDVGLLNCAFARQLRNIAPLAAIDIVKQRPGRAGRTAWRSNCISSNKYRGTRPAPRRLAPPSPDKPIRSQLCPPSVRAGNLSFLLRGISVTRGRQGAQWSRCRRTYGRVRRRNYYELFNTLPTRRQLRCLWPKDILTPDCIDAYSARAIYTISATNGDSVNFRHRFTAVSDCKSRY